MAEVSAAYERQLGFVSAEEQQQLGGTQVAVIGLGGVGGIAAELLVRAGVGAMSICDGDAFDTSNLNRQVGATTASLGLDKTDVMADRLLAINPSLALYALPPAASAQWQDEVLTGCTVIIQAADAPRAALTVLRAGRRLSIPVVEAVALPAVQIHAFSPEGPDPEGAMPTQGRNLDDFNDDEIATAMAISPLSAWIDGDGQPLGLSPDMLLATAESRTARGFGPHVWIAGALAALETIKIILGRGEIAWYPGKASLDPCLWQLFLAS